ncbi:MAG: hypothetical protein ABL882_12170, partial [Sphingopyxis sp.]
LMVVTLIERLRQQGLSANVRNIFTAPVLAELAAELDENYDLSLDFIVPPNLIPNNNNQSLSNNDIEEFRI